MADSQDDIVNIPRVTAQHPSVDFIQNNLPFYHGAFSTSFCRYDPQLQCFVPHAQAIQHCLSSDNGDGASGVEVLPPRQHQPAVLAMRFWSHILPDAMQRFTTNKAESELIKKSQLSIRTQTAWEGIYSQLQGAKERYNGANKGLRGRMATGYRRMYRTIADNSEVAGKVVTGLLNQDLVSPIKALVEVVFDAMRIAADARGKFSNAFNEDDLSKTFGDIDVFLSVFREDENIKEASIQLLVAILRAVEGCIEFFLSPSAKRTGRALVEGTDYQEARLNLIADIDAKSKALVREAERSETVGNREAMTRILHGMGQLVFMESRQGARVGYVSDQVEHVRGEVADVQHRLAEFQTTLMNKVDEMLSDGTRKRQDDLEFVSIRDRVIQLEQDRELFLKLLESSSRLKIENEELKLQASRDSSVVSTTQAWQHPAPYPTWAVPPWAQFIPPFYRAPPQIVHTSQPMHTQLDHGSQTISQIFQGKSPEGGDIEFILESSDAISWRSRSLVSQIVATAQFSKWATSSRSQRLLIQNDNSKTSKDSPEALSWFCAMVVANQRAREGSVVLVFFCGHHTEGDDAHTGTDSMIRSLISQLIQQASNLTDCIVDYNADIVGRQWDLDSLLGLFGHLIRQLPRRATAICILDGIDHYETNIFEHGLIKIMECLANLTEDGCVPPAFKVLATSASQTIAAHGVFENNEHGGEPFILYTSDILSGSQDVMELDI